MRHHLLPRLASLLKPALGTLCLALAVTAPVFAQGTYSLAPPTVGSGSVADADPPVIRPTTTPCKVQLFTNFQSGGNTQNFDYNPPSECVGPWSKVVFVGDFSATGTNQFDRTAEILLGNVMIYYGTTEEPSPTEQPTWHVESDVTAYSALLKSEQLGSFELGNYIEGPYCCSQYASAYLEFYPADAKNPAPRTADQVLALTDTAGAQLLNVPTDLVSQTFAFPANVEEAYLDVFTQGQNTDEFWWTCIPNDALTILAATYPCGSTAFRQAEITVDGKMAGLAPIYPYVFTGGFDPYDWRPIPGVQTLNFKPYRVNLTPFAGLLDDGQPHTVAVSVYDAKDYFLSDATLLLFQDKKSEKVTGYLTGSTLGGTPAPAETENINSFATTGNATVGVTDAQSYKLTGFVNTSHGKVETDVESQLSFSNQQVYTNGGDTVTWQQMTKASQKTIKHVGDTAYESVDNLTFPFECYYNFVPNADGSFSQTVGFDLKRTEYTSQSMLGKLLYSSSESNEVKPIDVIDVSAAGSLSGNPTNHSNQVFTYTDTLGHCWDRSVSADHELVSAVKDGAACKDGVNHWQ